MDYINQENKIQTSRSALCNSSEIKQTEYDEINIRDYTRVIIKRKNLILEFLLIGLIIAGAITFLLPINYKAETYLEIENYSKVTDRETSLIEISYNLIEKINTGFYGGYPRVKAFDLTEVGLIKIEFVSENPEEAKSNLENINKLILDEHNQKLEAKKKVLEKSLKELKERISFLLSRNKEVEILELEVFNIQRNADDFEFTRIARDPGIVSEKSPNLIFNLICGGISGIFIGVFLAFGKEWWERNKKRL